MVKEKPRSDAHAKVGKILRADDGQWSAWQREANLRTGGNLTAYLCLAADSMAASGRTARLRSNKVRFRK